MQPLWQEPAEGNGSGGEDGPDQETEQADADGRNVKVGDEPDN